MTPSRSEGADDRTNDGVINVGQHKHSGRKENGGKKTQSQAPAKGAPWLRGNYRGKR